MEDSEKLKMMMKELNLSNHKIAEITGHTYTSVNSMLSPCNKFPRWMKLVIWVWENTRKD